MDRISNTLQIRATDLVFGYSRLSSTSFCRHSISYSIRLRLPRRNPAQEIVHPKRLSVLRQWPLILRAMSMTLVLRPIILYISNKSVRDLLRLPSNLLNQRKHMSLSAATDFRKRSNPTFDFLSGATFKKVGRSDFRPQLCNVLRL